MLCSFCCESLKTSDSFAKATTIGESGVLRTLRLIIRFTRIKGWTLEYRDNTLHALIKGSRHLKPPRGNILTFCWLHNALSTKILTLTDSSVRK